VLAWLAGRRLAELVDRTRLLTVDFRATRIIIAS
jgi:hypothetical protein